MKNALSLLIALALLSSCAAKKTEIKTTRVILTPPPVNTATARDGSTLERALILPQVHEQEGVNAEYAELKRRYPGHKNGGQSLIYHDKKPYDVVKVITADGKEVTTYFDISNFFGKF
jgi:uncharacterized protein (UPF0210 family)